MGDGSRLTAAAANLNLSLRIGPTAGFGFTDAQLRRAWQAYGGQILREELALSPARRPWGWWRFVADEERPSFGDEAVRLAELGELRDDELGRVA